MGEQRGERRVRAIPVSRGCGRERCRQPDCNPLQNEADRADSTALPSLLQTTPNVPEQPGHEVLCVFKQHLHGLEELLLATCVEGFHRWKGRFRGHLSWQATRTRVARKWQ